MNTNQDSRETKLWRMKPDFFNCIKTVGLTENILTIKQIIEYLDKYILSKNLFNLNEGIPPKNFYLGDDPLSKVLGVKQFNIPELKILLPYQIIAVTNKQDTHGHNSAVEENKNEIIKRKLNDEGDESDPKKGRCEAQPYRYGTFVVPSPPSYFSGDETDYSVQSLETVVVSNSGDDILLYDGAITIQEYHNSRNNILSSGDEAGFEYEVESASCRLSFGCFDTRSDQEDKDCAALIISQDNSVIIFWADASDKDTSDPEQTLAKKWSCSHCGGLNDPLSRICVRCWDMKVRCLPEKNKHHPPTNIKKKPRPRPINEVHPFIKLGSRFCHETPEKINPAKSLPSTSQDLSKNEFTSNDSVFSLVQKSEINSNETADKIVPKCPICEVNSKSGISFLRTRPRCYKCAKIIQKSTQKCPVCQRSIFKVVQNFLVL